MKRTLGILSAVLLSLPFGARAQSQPISIGASASFLAPVGSLAYRFRSTVGGCLEITPSSGGQPVWSGSFEYFAFDRENTDKLILTRKVQDAGMEREFKIPLSLLTMKLEAIGVGANARFNLVTVGKIEANLDLGFGVYRWFFSRSGYYDTLRVSTSTGPAIAEILRVPEVTQQDWSGGFHGGAEVTVPVVEPVSVHLGARYKVIVGELWPALALDLDNVSTLRMLEIRFGISAAF